MNGHRDMIILLCTHMFKKLTIMEKNLQKSPQKRSTWASKNRLVSFTLLFRQVSYSCCKFRHGDGRRNGGRWERFALANNQTIFLRRSVSMVDPCLFVSTSCWSSLHLDLFCPNARDIKAQDKHIDHENLNMSVTAGGMQNQPHLVLGKQTTSSTPALTHMNGKNLQ